MSFQICQSGERSVSNIIDKGDKEELWVDGMG